MPNLIGAFAWFDPTYLRELAQRCTRIARECPHLATSQELEAIGVELMLKAAELDDLQKSAHGHELTNAQRDEEMSAKKL
jgi:hypothetical protein